MSGIILRLLSPLKIQPVFFTVCRCCCFNQISYAFFPVVSISFRIFNYAFVFRVDLTLADLGYQSSNSLWPNKGSFALSAKEVFMTLYSSVILSFTFLKLQPNPYTFLVKVSLTYEHANSDTSIVKLVHISHVDGTSFILSW